MLPVEITGASGGAPPFPSGSGPLAFIRFIVLGTGTSPIEVTGSVSTVPEPAAMTLGGARLLLAAMRRRRREGSESRWTCSHERVQHTDVCAPESRVPWSAGRC